MILDGETYFNMFRLPHKISGSSEYMLKRWTKHTIYSHSGSYKHADSQSWHSVSDPRFNLYSTNSIYLYDYVLVSDNFFFASVYTASVADFTIAGSSSYIGQVNGTSSYWHLENTWKNSPNATMNNYLLIYNPLASYFRGFPVYGFDSGVNITSIPSSYGLTVDQYQALMNAPVYTDDGTYFEIVRGYPRNHHIHKRNIFGADRFTSYGIQGDLVVGRTVTSSSFRTGMQDSSTTVGPQGLGDGSDPVQATTVTNIDLIQSDNVIFH